MEVKKIANIKETAKAYEPKQIKTIADLEVVSLEDLDVKENTSSEFPYNFVVVDGVEYKVPLTVLADLKEILKEKPNLQTFKVNKEGEGLKTKYTTISLD